MIHSGDHLSLSPERLAIALLVVSPLYFHCRLGDGKGPSGNRIGRLVTPDIATPSYAQTCRHPMLTPYP